MNSRRDTWRSARHGSIDATEAATWAHDKVERSRWLRAITGAGVTVDLVARSAVMLMSAPRLIATEMLPAIWIGAITWDWRVHSSGRVPLPRLDGWWMIVVILAVLVLNTAAYWCNTVIAFTLAESDVVRLRAATGRANRRWRTIVAFALTVGSAHAFVSVVGPRLGIGFYSVTFGIVAMIQMYALVALPSILAGLSTRRPQGRERVHLIAASAVIVLVAVTPGLALTRLGVYTLDHGPAWLAIVIIVLGTLLQIAGVAAARAVKFVARGVGPTPNEPQERPE